MRTQSGQRLSGCGRERHAARTLGIRLVATLALDLVKPTCRIRIQAPAGCDPRQHRRRRQVDRCPRATTLDEPAKIMMDIALTSGWAWWAGAPTAPQPTSTSSREMPTSGYLILLLGVVVVATIAGNIRYR